MNHQLPHLVAKLARVRLVCAARNRKLLAHEFRHVEQQHHSTHREQKHMPSVVLADVLVLEHLRRPGAQQRVPDGESDRKAMLATGGRSLPRHRAHCQLKFGLPALPKMADTSGAEEEEVAVIRKPKSRSFRKRRADAEPEPDASLEPEALSSLHAMRTLQRQRARARGVALDAKGELDLEDQIGGESADEEPGDVAAVLGATFTQQTEGGDVDPNMLRYIEEAMGKDPNAKPGAPGGTADALDDEAELYKTPAFLLARKPKLSEQAADHEDAQRWLAGIEEVQLSTEEKLLNIEHTEKAKAKMLEKLESRMKRSVQGGGGGGSFGGRGGGDSVLPGNFTSNFHHHRKSMRKKNPLPSVVARCRPLPLKCHGRTASLRPRKPY